MVRPEELVNRQVVAEAAISGVKQWTTTAVVAVSALADERISRLERICRLRLERVRRQQDQAIAECWSTEDHP